MKKKLLAEYIGTFFLVFCGTGSIIINEERGGVITNSGIAITFGLIVMVMILAFGKISGAHFNPAVTLTFRVQKKIDNTTCFGYVLTQFIAAISASALLHFLFPLNHSLGLTQPSGSFEQSFIFEFLLSFLLMFVILQVAHHEKEEGFVAAMAIGFTVLLEALFAGPVCGASMNPARTLGPAIVSGQFSSLWIYLSAPLAGMLSAATIKRKMDQLSV